MTLEELDDLIAEHDLSTVYFGAKGSNGLTQCSIYFVAPNTTCKISDVHHWGDSSESAFLGALEEVHALRAQAQAKPVEQVDDLFGDL